ncbi:MAG: YciI-like protein [Pseudomonadota bacterium]|nr:YciI-like protein [Pseudomonadota bacterium]
MTEKHFILFYDTAPDYLERRPQFRGAHLDLARAAQQRGDLVLAGALADPPDGAVLIFKGETDAAARAFAEADPYVRNGLIKSWRVREWTTVVGDGALTKV